MYTVAFVCAGRGSSRDFYFCRKRTGLREPERRIALITASSSYRILSFALGRTEYPVGCGSGVLRHARNASSMLERSAYTETKVGFQSFESLAPVAAAPLPPLLPDGRQRTSAGRNTLHALLGRNYNIFHFAFWMYMETGTLVLHQVIVQ